jgi:ATP-dependent DNA helicase PIF1
MRPPCPLQVAVTAPTGTAAINVKGTTIHSFGRLGLAKGSKEQLAQEAWDDSFAQRRWREVDVLVIDEGSMVSDELFDKLEYVARWVRGGGGRRKGGGGLGGGGGAWGGCY